MCGRYLAVSSPEALAEHFAVTENVLESPGPRYNVAPSTQVPAVIEHEAGRRLGALRWGFIPHWARELGSRHPINARAETVATSKLFARAFARHRCLLPADGFYEWLDRGKGHPKQPYHLAAPDGAPLALAGIWSVWRPPEGSDGEKISSCAIITTEARGAMEQIHHRMPVILPESLWKDWLSGASDDAPHLADTIAALGPPRLTATPITDRVNSVRNDGPELLTPGSVDD